MYEAVYHAKPVVSLPLITEQAETAARVSFTTLLLQCIADCNMWMVWSHELMKGVKVWYVLSFCGMSHLSNNIAISGFTPLNCFMTEPPDNMVLSLHLIPDLMHSYR